MTYGVLTADALRAALMQLLHQTQCVSRVSVCITNMTCSHFCSQNLVRKTRCNTVGVVPSCQLPHKGTGYRLP